MKLFTFYKNNSFHVGIKSEEELVDLEEALQKHPSQKIPLNFNQLLSGGEQTRREIEKYLQQLEDKEEFLINENEMEWGPVVPHPHKIICVGLNYRRHADETGAAYPETPILFSKFDNTLTGHNSKVPVPNETQKLDYEVELGIVIGEEAKNVSETEALNYVYGYCTTNDLSARDLQLKTPQWLLGKSCDGFSPIGPYLVTADEVGDPQNLNVKTTVNGEVRQDSNTSDMIFSCQEIVSYISRHMTLVPGDIILTGTPEGVILGMPEKDQKWLQAGDQVTVEIEKLGTLTTTFI
ncbi:fumarylacetoacetate hydrolase family protein [Salibacterium aidingense]|uniref:fumarylacetoacetate hydrolase family protein n=1 Tax=Salibacterium aidingense TaxID=384933 RepID=UPI003BE8CD1C